MRKRTHDASPEDIHVGGDPCRALAAFEALYQLARSDIETEASLLGGRGGEDGRGGLSGTGPSQRSVRMLSSDSLRASLAGGEGGMEMGIEGISALSGGRGAGGDVEWRVCRDGSSSRTCTSWLSLEHWHSSGSGGEVECKCLDGVASPFSGAQRAVFLVLWSHRDDGKNASSPRRLRGSERALNM